MRVPRLGPMAKKDESDGPWTGNTDSGSLATWGRCAPLLGRGVNGLQFWPTAAWHGPTLYPRRSVPLNAEPLRRWRRRSTAQAKGRGLARGGVWVYGVQPLPPPQHRASHRFSHPRAEYCHNGGIAFAHSHGGYLGRGFPEAPCPRAHQNKRSCFVPYARGVGQRGHKQHSPGDDRLGARPSRRCHRTSSRSGARHSGRAEPGLS
jgi:hypothetical protein